MGNGTRCVRPQKPPIMHKLLLALAICLPLVASAGILDDLEELQGKTVVYAGDFERLTCPIGGKYDCLTWPNNLFKTKRGRDLCFAASSYSSCGYSCKGVIAVGDNQTAYVFFIEGIGGDMKKARMESYRCPSMF